jgi:hypothetical protein
LSIITFIKVGYRESIDRAKEANMAIRRIYVAGILTPKGPNSTHPAIDYLLNVRNMIRASMDVLFAGYDPFCPALDFQFFLSLREGERITEPMIKRYSKSMLEACEAVVLTPNWRKSEGTIAEIEHAEKMGIPVFESLEELREHVANS